jgi:hypothetical protein
MKPRTCMDSLDKRPSNGISTERVYVIHTKVLLEKVCKKIHIAEFYSYKNLCCLKKQSTLHVNQFTLLEMLFLLHCNGTLT